MNKAFLTIYNIQQVGSYHFYLGNRQTLTCVVINCMTNKGMTNGGGGGGIPSRAISNIINHTQTIPRVNH